MGFWLRRFLSGGVVWLLCLLLFAAPAFATTTQFYSTAADGYEENTQEMCDGDPSYADTRDATTATIYNDADNPIFVGHRIGSEANNDPCTDNIYWRTISRAFLYFATGDTIASGDTVSSATLYFKMQAAGTAGHTICAQKGTQAATLTNADYDSFTGSSYGSADWTVTGSYLSITITAADIVKGAGGITKIVLRNCEHDYTNADPGMVDVNGRVYLSEQTGTGSDPYLDVTYTAGTQSTSVNMTGGALGGGTATVKSGVKIAMVGGGLSGGTATIKQGEKILMTGGGIVGGSATVTPNNLQSVSATMAGGGLVGGTAMVAKSGGVKHIWIMK